MTSQADPTLEQIISYFPTPFQYECCLVALTALVVYDWALTLSREVRLFWTARAYRSPAAILYFSNKYLNVLSTITNILIYAPQSDKSCTRTDTTGWMFLDLSVVPPAVFNGLRVYALTHHSWLSVFVFFLSSVQFITSMAALLRYPLSDIHFGSWGCMELTGPPLSLDRIFVITNRVSVLVADTMLIAITWKTLPDHHIANYMAQGRVKGLASIMLFSGLTYFIVLSIMNVSLLALSQEFIVAYGQNIFIAPLSSVLVSHFLLDLQEAHQRTVVGLATDDVLHISQSTTVSSRSVNFAPVLGSLAATIHPINYGWEGDDEEVTDGHSPTLEDVPLDESRHTQESGLVFPQRSGIPGGSTQRRSR